jgi:hypothetical protein
MMAASRGAHCPVECCVYRRIGASWVTPLPSMPRHFGRTVMVFRAIPSPVFRLEKPGSSSCGLGSPPEFVVPTSARASGSYSRTTRDRGRLPWGLHPLRDVSSASPLSTSIPGPSMFRPQRFSRSRRLAPRCPLQACFILLPRPGFSLQGVTPPTQPNHLVDGPSLRAVGTYRLPPVARRRQQPVRRPRGLDPSRDPQHP